MRTTLQQFHPKFLLILALFLNSLDLHSKELTSLNNSVAIDESKRFFSQITGRVTSSEGEPLPGVNVLIKGTTIGSTTDGDGYFSLSGLEAGTHVIIASYVGYFPSEKTITVSGEKVNVDFVLKEELLEMREVVVTGASNVYSTLESSTAITTLNSKTMELRAPRNTADLIKSIPGFWVESSGGEVANNVQPRGLPTDGFTFRYLMMQEDGLPVFQVADLALASADLFIRADETYDRVEAIRGGTSSIFASSSPGGIINFISKTGGTTFSGNAKITTALHGLIRNDLNLGGPLSKDKSWRYNIGGFYRYDTGVRKTGFPVNNGYQIRGNISKIFNKGLLRVYGKYLNDRNTFYLPIPYNNINSPTSFPGFDISKNTLITDDAKKFTIYDHDNPSNGRIDVDTEDGFLTKLFTIGGEFTYDLSSTWTISNKMRFINGRSDKRQQFINTVLPLQDLGNSFLGNSAGLPGTSVDFSYVSGNLPIEQNSLASLNGNGLAAINLLFYINKPISNFIDDLRITKKVGSHSLTGGFYFSRYTTNDLWNFNVYYTDVAERPKRLTLNVRNENGTLTRVTDTNGMASYLVNNAYGENTTNVMALYGNDEWKINEKLRVDAGFRVERLTTQGRVSRIDRSENIDSDPLTLYDNNVRIKSTTNFRNYDINFDDWAASVGANYMLNEQSSIFSRISRGYKMPNSDQWFRNENADGSTPTGFLEAFLQIEGGYKLTNSKASIFASPFYSAASNVLANITNTDENGSIIQTNTFVKTRTIGLELEAKVYPAKGLTLSTVTTLQDSKYREYNVILEGEQVDFSGNQTIRTPNIILDLSAAYTFAKFSINGNFRYYDRRFGNARNTNILPAYNEVNANVFYDFSPTLKAGIQVSNLFNSTGITEGNPRLGESFTREDLENARLNNTTPLTGRPILPRIITLTLGYSF